MKNAQSHLSESCGGRGGGGSGGGGWRLRLRRLFFAKSSTTCAPSFPLHILGVWGGGGGGLPFTLVN